MHESVVGVCRADCVGQVELDPCCGHHHPEFALVFGMMFIITRQECNAFFHGNEHAEHHSTSHGKYIIDGR